MFKSSHPITAVTRIATWSEFDHVALVLKFSTDPNEVYFIESVSGVGVRLNAWTGLRTNIGHNKFYQKCVFRHVVFDRSFENLNRLQKLLKEALGHQYALGLNTMLRRSTVSPFLQPIQKERTFFCSELVARAFKEAGIISNDKSSTSFYP